MDWMPQSQELSNRLNLANCISLSFCQVDGHKRERPLQQARARQIGFMMAMAKHCSLAKVLLATWQYTWKPNKERTQHTNMLAHHLDLLTINLIMPKKTSNRYD